MKKENEIYSGPDKKKGAGEEKPVSIGREIFEYVRLFVILLVIVIFAERFLIVNAVIPSESMEPTVMTGDRLFGNRLAYLKDDPQRFDVVIFRYPDDESKLFIKRVIGLPGDTIDIHDGEVYINGEETPLDDSFCMLPDSTDAGNLTGPITVPDGYYFMLGDNRLNSKDSRYWENTFVARDKILGKAVLRYWPLTKISVIH